MTKSIFDNSTLRVTPKGRTPELIAELNRMFQRSHIGVDEALKLYKQYILAYAAATGNSEKTEAMTGHLTGLFKTTQASKIDSQITDNKGLKLGGRKAHGLVFKSRPDRELAHYVVTEKYKAKKIRSTPTQFANQVYRQDGNRYLALSCEADVQMQVLLKGQRFFAELETALCNSKDQLFVTWLAEKAWKLETKSGLLLF